MAYSGFEINNMIDPSLNGAAISASISNNLDTYEAARSAFFVLEVSGLDNLVRSEFSGEIADATASNVTDSKYKFEKAAEALRLNVTKCDVPHFSIAPLEFKRGNDTIKFAGLPSFGTGSLTVDDVIGLQTKSILMAWQGLAYNVRTRKGGRMWQYKKDCTLMEYTQDYQLLRTWTLYGCWVSDISESSFDRSSDEKRELTATIQYDRAEMIDADLETVK